MSQWNPNSTATKGLEWFPHTSREVALDSAGKAFVHVFTANANENIDSIRIHVPTVTTQGYYECEVVALANIYPTGNSFGLFYPNEDAVDGGVTGVSNNTAGQLYQNIDEASLDPADYLTGDGATINPYFDWRANMSTPSLTGKRVLKVQPAWYLQNLGSSSKSDLSSGLVLNGTLYSETTADLANVGALAQDVTYLHYLAWYRNPYAVRPWLLTDVALFDTTDEVRAQMRQLYATTSLRWYNTNLNVTYCTENRVARGTTLVSAAGWTTFTLTTPTGGTWAKASGTVYAVILRRLQKSNGSITLRSLYGETACPVASISGYSDTSLNADGTVALVGTAQARYTSPVVPIVGGAPSNEAVPYAKLVDGLVYTGQAAEQEFSDAAATTYGVIRALVRYSGTPTADLTVEIWSRTSGLKVGTGTLTITKAQVDALPALGPAQSSGIQWRMVTGQLSSPSTLAAGTQYYLKFVSSTSSANPWIVQAVYNEGSWYQASFGGTVDRALVNGAESDSYDLCATVATVPTTPSGLVAPLATQALPGDGSGCTVDNIRYVALDWTSTALGGSFGYYEVERTEDAGTTWVKVAHITTEASSAFNDYETPRGVAVQYRLRVVRTDEAFSAWTSATTAVTCRCNGVEWLFVSNETPALNVGFQRDAEMTYEFLLADEVVFRRIYGRDFQVAFQPTEDPGVAFDVPLHISAVTTPTTIGLPVFDSIRAICEADSLSYVCVLDPNGNRWFAKATIGAGDHREPGQLYEAVVRVTEVSATPSTPPNG